jgi:DNA-binding NarL/FixJ family response regulator
MDCAVSFYGPDGTLMKKLKRRVLIADDHPVVCKALAQMLNRQGDLTCCGIVENAASASSAVDEHLPDLVLLDLNFKDGDGINLIKLLRNKNPDLRVLVVSQFNDHTYAEASLKAGARGYVTKSATVKEILMAIRTVLAGNIYFKKINGISLQRTGGDAVPLAKDGKAAKLTKRELEVLQMLGSGVRTKDIAIRLNLSIKTIETYRENLKEKLSLNNSSELVHFAICWMEYRILPT